MHTVVEWAGTGKSAIARTVARHYDDVGSLAASFFFSRGGGDSSHTGLFVTSLAHQLAECNKLDIQDDVRRSLKGHSQIASQTLQDQWTRLVMQPLSRHRTTGKPSVFLMVLDALDECEDERNIGTLLRFLPQVRELSGIRMRILVTSRPEIPIRHGFKRVCYRQQRYSGVLRAPLFGDCCRLLLPGRLARSLGPRTYGRASWGTLYLGRNCLQVC
jgi:hypothetical protein